MRFAAFAFFLTVLLDPVGAHAAIRADIQGGWAFPSCENPVMRLHFNQHFVMMATPQSSTLHYIDPAQEKENATVLTITNDGNPYDLKIGPQGKLMQFPHRYADKIPAGQSPFADEKNYLVIKYASCGGAPDAEEQTVFRLLDDAEKTCHGKKAATDAGCQQGLFGIFDANNDGALDNAELTKAYRRIVVLAVSNGCNRSAYLPGTIDADAPLFATGFITQADRDGSGTLTLDEMRGGMPFLTDHEKSKTLRGMIRHLGNLLPWLPRGELLAGCTCTPAPSQNAD